MGPDLLDYTQSYGTGLRFRLLDHLVNGKLFLHAKKDLSRARAILGKAETGLNFRPSS